MMLLGFICNGIVFDLKLELVPPQGLASMKLSTKAKTTAHAKAACTLPKARAAFEERARAVRVARARALALELTERAWARGRNLQMPEPPNVLCFGDGRMDWLVFAGCPYGSGPRLHHRAWGFEGWLPNQNASGGPSGAQTPWHRKDSADAWWYPNPGEQTHRTTKPGARRAVWAVGGKV
jgi:hypothetical protein